MPFFDFLFGAAPAVERFRGQAITANVTALAQALAGEATIRLYVDRGGGTGQQAAAINLLKRIIAPTAPATPNIPPGLGYTGDGKSVDVIYDDRTDTTLTNLQRLPGFAADVTQGVFQGLKVELLPLSAPGQLALVGYSFSAATDGGADIAYETICVARRHLRLQPFMYGDAGKEQLRFAGAPPEVIGLASRPEIGGAAFHELGFYLPSSPLDAAADAARLRRIRMLRYLIETQYQQAGSQLVKR